MDWVCIYNSSFIHKVEIVKAVFADNNINSIIINKQDFSYHFGEIELSVHPYDVMLSKQIINKEKL